MQRRKFLTSTLVATTLIANGKSINNIPPKKGFLVKNGEARNGIHTPFKGINPNDIKISSKDTDGMLSMFEYIGNEKTGPTLHIHFDQDEIFYIIEGEYLFQIGEEKMNVKAGDTVFGLRNVPHTWIQLSDTGRMVYLLQPAGKMEEFFLKMSQFKNKPSDEELQEIHLAHGMKVLGPPLSLK